MPSRPRPQQNNGSAKSPACSQSPAPAVAARAQTGGPQAERKRLIGEAEKLISRQQYRTAERILVGVLQDVGSSATSALALDDEVALLSALGEIYVRSGRYESARRSLTRAITAGNRVAEPGQKLLAQQATATVLLSQACTALGDVAAGVSSLKTMWARCQRASRVDPVAGLELLAELAAYNADVRSQGAPLALADEVRRMAERLGDDRRRSLVGTEDYARALGSLAECQAQSADWQSAIGSMQKIIRLRADRHEIVPEISAAKRLAEIHRQHTDIPAEIEVLQQGIDSLNRFEAQNKTGTANSLARRLHERAELQRLMAAALQRSEKGEQTIRQLRAAENDYTAALALVEKSSLTEPGGVESGRLLERLADVNGRLLEFQPADPLRLRQTIAAHERLLDYDRQNLLADDPRAGSLKVILGGLYLKDGDGHRAGPLLEEALTYWRNRRPKNSLRLAQTLHLLGQAALSAVPAPPASTILGHLNEAHRLCLAEFPNDPLRWRCQLALGQLNLATGRYRQALADLQPLVDSSATASQDVESAAFLQLGLLHKQLLRFDEADRLCRRGLELRQGLPGASAAELAAYFLALGSIEIARRDPAALAEIVDRSAALELNGSQHVALRCEFAHQQAMVHYLRNEQTGDGGERQAAREIWERSLAEEVEVPAALRARVLHFLSRLDYLDWSSDVDAWQARFANHDTPQAENLAKLTEQLAGYERDRQQFLADSAAYDNPRGAEQPLAERQRQFRDLLERRTALEQKRVQLREAHAAALDEEQRRAQAASGVQQVWLEKVAHGLKLSDQAVRLLSTDAAYPSLQFVALCNGAQLIEAQCQYLGEGRALRMRQALSQLEAAVALIEQPRASAVGDEASRAEFFAQYRMAFDLLVQFHVDAYERSGDDDHLIRALVAAEQSRGRALLDQIRLAYIAEPENAPNEPSQLTTSALAALIGGYQNTPQPLLYYYVGAVRSYLFLLGGSEKRLQAIRLHVATEGAEAPAGTRAIDLHAYRLYASLSNEQSAAAIGVDRALRERLAASSQVLLPAEAIEYLERERVRGASYALVVPHGAIAQIPLEALVLKEGQTLYLNDVAPPLAYAPSLALLDRLTRSAVPTSLSPNVLTLGNPSYGPPRGAEHGSLESTLEPLPRSQQECDRIQQLFGAALVTRLDRASASEQRLRLALGERRYSLIHLAAHGVLRGDDLNPWLALSTPAQPNPPAQADGKLELGEIYGLNLTGCELTVLSACNTNLDPRQAAQLRSLRADLSEPAATTARPILDTGFSIANAFLAAGSRRVVGTQWTVADDSTADLIARLFEKVHAELAAGRRVNFARLLNDARRESRRSNPAWDTPFHWAPFVFIGPAELPR
jgi:CHAT domain-containing protein